jgi:glycosyltransferase involved in cell wall biosynthesis
MDRTVVVIPCYDEAERLDVSAFRRFAARAPDVQLLFVDDGSRDETLRVLDALRQECPDRVDVLRLPTNAGKAEAVRHGVLEAMRRGCEFVAFWDADLSTSLDEIDCFRATLRERPEIEMVFAARVNLLGREVRRKLSRHYLGRIFATLVAFSLRLPIYDTQCGAKMFRVTDDLRLVMSERFLSRWVFDVEILARFLLLRRAASGRTPLRSVIVEEPLQRWTDVHGSKLRPWHFAAGMVDFVRIYVRYLRRIGGGT